MDHPDKTTRPARSAARNELLDSWRFVAAFTVVLYHYSYIGPAIGRTGEAALPALAEFAKYGYLGVSFFFMISGYVIFQSAQHGNANRFIASRVSRLFPAYWIAVPISYYALIIAPGQDLTLPFHAILINMSMLQGFVGVPHIDNVYWTLTVELMFYALIVGLIWMRALQQLKWVAVLLLSIATLHHTLGVPSAAYLLAQPDWSPYFMAGCAFFWLRDNTASKALPAVILLWSLAVCLVHADAHATAVALYTGSPLSSSVAVGLTASLFAVFAFTITRGATWQIPGAALLGAISYPLYLLHQNVGYTALAYLATPSNSYLVVALVVSVMVALSVGIALLIENPMRKPLHQTTMQLAERMTSAAQTLTQLPRRVFRTVE